MYIKYQHLERYGNEAVDGIETGMVYVFPKLDGTNASVWLEDGQICAGNRNRKLTLDNDNAGFYNYIITHAGVREFLLNNPNLTLYGEWLVPHSLKTYREDAWRKFYVFDVYNRDTDTYYDYNTYNVFLWHYGIDYLAPIRIIKNGNREQFERCLNENIFLIKDGQGVGEGIVLKNYDYTNKFGNVVWAKMITNAFKEVHHKEMGAPISGGMTDEERIVEEFVDVHLVEKTYNKILTEKGGWSSKNIPELLNRVYHDLVTEELWDILKKYNQPRIDFKFMQRMSIAKIKQIKPEIFNG